MSSSQAAHGGAPAVPPQAGGVVGRAVVEAHGIVKAFRDGGGELPVLGGVDLAVAPGEIVCLEGPSGSGKTTLLSIVGCILAASAGRLAICGERLRPGDEAQRAAVRRRSIGFVFQQFNLFPALTAEENVAYALGLRGWDDRRAAAEARRAIAQVDLAARGRSLPRALSGGQQQRVAIARALAGGAPLILADEPTANLDHATGERILGLFAGLARAERRSVLIVTHDPRVRAIADRTLAMRDGLLQERAPP